VALDPLATTADLSARGITTGNVSLALSVASAAIRDAAGASIGPVTGTVIVPAPRGSLLLLPGPVSAVTEVLVDGTAVTDYKNLGNGLWRRCGWGCEPVPVSGTATFGLAAVPEDIVNLTCDLAKAWLDHAAAGGGSTAGLKSASIDDASESYTDEAAGQVSPVFLPKVTRNWLAARFGGGPVVVETL
jgi:hypothetical protein